MNAALQLYLSELVDAAKVNTGYAYALHKCAGIVRRARSPLNPAKIDLLSNFGDGLTSQRVRGHFNKEEQRNLLSQTPPSDLGGRVKDWLAEVLAQGQFGGKTLSRALRTRFEKTSDGLEAFLSLEDARDISLLKCCTPELLGHLVLCFPPPKKQRVALARNATARRTAIKRKRSSTSVGFDSPQSQAFVEALLPEVTPDKAPVPCKILTGGWAIMVGLHLAGAPQTKTQLVELSSRHGLCREPLVKKQRTVSRPGQWYDAWSSHTRLCRDGWLVRKGSLYALTDPGRVEAAKYAQQREDFATSKQGPSDLSEECVQRPTTSRRKMTIFGEGVSGKDAHSAERSSSSSLHCTTAKNYVDENVPDVTAGKAFKFPASLGSRAHCTAIDLSDSDDGAPLLSLTHTLRREAPSSSKDVASTSQPAVSSTSTAAAFKVLVDLCEDPKVRDSMAQMLPSSVQMRLPGIDYAFGKFVDGEWILANVLVERKTVHDYLATLNSERGEFQAHMHASLKESGFSVLVILEGINDLKQHPQHAEILAAAHSSIVPVLTTASINDTVQLLLALATNAHAHDGWTLTALQVMMQHHYAVDPASVCEAVLVSLGIAREFARSVASTCGSLPALLAELSPGTMDGADADACIERLASKTGLTLFQMGKVLQAVGIKHVHLSRKRGPRFSPSLACEQRVRKRWSSGLLVEPTAYITVGQMVGKALKKSLKAFAEVREADGLSPDNMVEICHGRFSEAYRFRIGGGSCLDVGAHWLLLAKDLDWKDLTARRAHAFVSGGVVSSLCTSAEQVVQHIAARFKAMYIPGLPAESTSRHVLESGSGLASVFRLAQTAGGSLPLRVAKELAEHEEVSSLGLAQLSWKLKSEGPAFILSLGVREIGVERAASVKALLLGGA